jgi:hypothetical protein
MRHLREATAPTPRTRQPPRRRSRSPGQPPRPPANLRVKTPASIRSSSSFAAARRCVPRSLLSSANGIRFQSRFQRDHRGSVAGPVIPDQALNTVRPCPARCASRARADSVRVGERCGRHGQHGCCHARCRDKRPGCEWPDQDATQVIAIGCSRLRTSRGQRACRQSRCAITSRADSSLLPSMRTCKPTTTRPEDLALQPQSDGSS